MGRAISGSGSQLVPQTCVPLTYGKMKVESACMLYVAVRVTERSTGPIAYTPLYLRPTAESCVPIDSDQYVP